MGPHIPAALQLCPLAQFVTRSAVHIHKKTKTKLKHMAFSHSSKSDFIWFDRQWSELLWKNTQHHGPDGFTFASATSARTRRPAPHCWSPPSPGTLGSRSRHDLSQTYSYEALHITRVLRWPFSFFRSKLFCFFCCCCFVYLWGRWGYCCGRRSVSAWSEACSPGVARSALAGNSPL